MEGKVMIGVTGGLATGKTTVAAIFRELGAIVIDADEISHRLLAEDDALKDRVSGLFGRDILVQGEIDRRKLAGRVFSDRRKLDELCGILHPLVISRVRKEASAIQEGVIVLDAPLLLEAGLRGAVDAVVVVAAAEETQVKRAVDRGITESEARAIIDCQMPLAEKKRSADYIIENDNGMDILKEGVNRIWQKILREHKKNWI